MTIDEMRAGVGLADALVDIAAAQRYAAQVPEGSADAKVRILGDFPVGVARAMLLAGQSYCEVRLKELGQE